MRLEPEGCLGDLSEQQRRLARLKFEILADGVQLTDRATRALFEPAGPVGLKKPLRTRSGVSGGLDLRLSHDVFVNAPVSEPFARESGVVLDWHEDQYRILRQAEVPWPVELLPEPCFYSRRTRDGVEQMRRVAQMCSPDRLCYGMTGPACVFWAPDNRCQFCSIGLNASSDAGKKREEHLYEVLEAAVAEPTWPARHILLGGGTPPGRDMGATLAARLCKEIKRRTNVSVYVMIAAPLDDTYIDALYDSGVDELGMNLEFWSDQAWAQYIPGKRNRIGKARYLAALDYAFKRFGAIRTRSILIAGLEPAKETLAAVTVLSAMGVMPILSPFRPLAGTALQSTRGFTVPEYLELYEQCQRATGTAGLPLGPTCICCQNNTLALPFGPMYRRYGTDTPPVR